MATLYDGYDVNAPSEKHRPYATLSTVNQLRNRTMSSQWHLEELAKSGRHSLRLTTLDGLTTIPFTVLTGEEPTPVALVIAGVHGDEYEGPAAIHALME